MKESKVVLLKGFAPKDEMTLNDLTKDGWNLVSVSFNQAYLEREKQNKTLYIKGNNKGENANSN